MPKEDKAVDPSVDVQVISVPAGGTGGQIHIPTAAQNSNGVVVLPLPQGAGYPAQAPAAGPAVILITVGTKSEEKKDKKTSSVFQRL